MPPLFSYIGGFGESPCKENTSLTECGRAYSLKICYCHHCHKRRVCVIFL